MKTVVLGDPPPVLASLLAERKRLGLDRHDEVWHGEYHMAPAANARHGKVGLTIGALLHSASARRGLYATMEFSLGSPDDFRVPDLGVHRGDPIDTWLPTAAIVVEVRTPDDETYDKFEFYFEHGVAEILVADLETETVTWFVRGESAFVAAPHSDLLPITTRDVVAALGWTDTGSV